MAEELKYGVKAVDVCVNCGKSITLSSSFSSDYLFAGAGLLAKRGYMYWHHSGDNSYFCDNDNNNYGTKPVKPTEHRGELNLDYKPLYDQVIEKYEQLLFQLEELKREKNNLVGMQLPLPLVPAHEK